MFWLFRRKKVADTKAITPCVCESDTQLQGAFTLREFASTLDRCLTPRSTSEGALSRLTFSDTSRGTRKGYHRLQCGENLPAEEAVSPPPQQMPFTPASRVPPTHPETLESTSSPSSTDYSDCDGDFTGNSDSDDDDEELTCSVCDRSFRTVRHLEQHQQRKRHYGCCICDTIFPNLMALELHKETLDHWSEDELRLRSTDTDDEEYSLEDEAKGPEELERLL